MESRRTRDYSGTRSKTESSAFVGMRFNNTTTGIRAVGGLLAVGLLAGYHSQNTSLRQQVDELDKLRNHVAEITRRFDTDIARATNAASQRATTVSNELIGLRSAMDESNAEAQAAVSAVSALSERVAPNSRMLTEELLAPAVQLNGPVSVGSGTLVCSRFEPSTGEVLNYVLTAWHVVRDIIDEDPNGLIQVTVYERDGRKTEVVGKLAAHAEAIDSALVRLRSDRIFTHVAKVLPANAARAISIWDPIVAVGCPLGNDPIPTTGAVASLQNPIGDANYWMINAPGYFGNSGGGVFETGDRRLIGVYSKVYTYKRGGGVAHGLDRAGDGHPRVACRGEPGPRAAAQASTRHHGGNCRGAGRRRLSPVPRRPFGDR